MSSLGSVRPHTLMTTRTTAPVTTAAPTALAFADGSPASTGWTLSDTALHTNHGSFGAVPRRVQEEQNRLRAVMDAGPVDWFSTLPARVGDARRAIAGIVGTAPEHTALVPNASGGASVVYNSLTAEPGAEIVVTDHGYGAVTMGAERAARRWGGQVVTARVPLDATPAEAHERIMAACSDATRLIVIDHITSATARFLPVREVAASARQRGITTLVDGAHVPGLYDAPLDGLDCDVWVGNLHKFACSPRGAAVLVASGELRHELFPLIDSWGAPHPFPERFDTQGTLDQTSYLTAPDSYAFIDEHWGWPAVRAYMTELADYAETLIADAFAARTGEDHRVDVGAPVNALRLVRLPAGLATTHPEADALRDRVVREFGVEAAFTSFNGIGYYRLSTHAYNTARDFEAFVDRLVPTLCELAVAAPR